MKKKVLIIGTSPRLHGNTNILAKSFAKGAEAAGHDVNLSPWPVNALASVSVVGAVWKARPASSTTMTPKKPCRRFVLPTSSSLPRPSIITK